MNTRSWLWFARKHIWNIIEEIVFEKSRKCNFWSQFLQKCCKYASEQVLVGIWCLKHQKLFKTLIRIRFQGMYWCAHKTATLTSIQHCAHPPCCLLSKVYAVNCLWCYPPPPNRHNLWTAPKCPPQDFAWVYLLFCG